MIFGLLSCSKRIVPANFYVLSEDGEWVKQEGSDLPEEELLLTADADGNGMLAGDTVQAVGWNSEKDGTGSEYEKGDPGDWYAKYEVTECTVSFSANLGEGKDPEPASVNEDSSWKVTKPNVTGLKKHFGLNWYKDAELKQEFNFETDTISHSLTLYGGIETPLCFTALIDGCSVTLKKYGSPANISLETSDDGGETWEPYTIDSAIALDTGKSVYFAAKDINGTFSTNTNKFYQFDFGDDVGKKIAASGNIMSLLDSSLSSKTLSDYVFCKLFCECKSLVSAPELPATTLAKYCYWSMFGICTSLESAPNLPATELKESCYTMMFAGCTLLNDVTVKFTSWPPSGDLTTTNWLGSVAATGTFHCPADLQGAGIIGSGSGSASKIPDGWTVVNDVN